MPQSRTALSLPARAHEAGLLAVMLRTSRLTWVFGEPGADKSALLRTGVLPLLQRRCLDRGAAPAAAAQTIATPERRRPSAARQGHPRIEAAVYFDSWGDTPLTLLKRRIGEVVPAASQGSAIAGACLADMLQSLNRQCGVHVIFLLDRFETYLAMAPEAGEVAQFANELVEAVLHQDLPASFLVAMDEVARSRLERFRLRMPGFDQNFLRMSALPELHDSEAQSGSATPVEDAAAANIQHALPAGRAVARPRRRPAPSAPVKVEDIYAFIEATLAKTTVQSPVEPGQAAVDTPAGPASVSPEPPAQRGAPGAARAIPGAAQRDGASDEDSFFSFPHDAQRHSDRVKRVRRQGLAAALAWLKKQQ